ncbi:helix-turn-helix transcriptional regulator [Clostridium peptidivorans]|uniref:helix-turn-helix transcriptional regulator n=1 Tax=Clostridium peptidivorans TaxID=100174 RepID=UPI000BE3DE3C|nr:transcriptional regulator [Clostridium peptidivorans]
MEVKNRLKEIRMKEYAMEPGEFAALIKVNVKTYYAWELANAIPSMKEGLRVAKELHKKIDDIWYLE